MKKIITYAMLFAAAAIIHPLVYFGLQPVKKLGFSPEITGFIISILPILLILTFAQIIIIFNESQPIEFIPTSIDEHPSLDWQPLNKHTQELEFLGFHKLIDYKPSNLSRPGLARLFAHPEHHCFAEVYQISGLPTVCVVSSAMTEKWSLSNLDMQPQGLLGGLAYMRRGKRSLWIAQPNRSPSEILNYHLLCRQKLIEDLGIQIPSDLSSEAYFERQRAEAKRRLKVMKSKWLVIGLIEAIGYAISPKSEWIGEYKNHI